MATSHFCGSVFFAASIKGKYIIWWNFWENMKCNFCYYFESLENSDLNIELKAIHHTYMHSFIFLGSLNLLCLKQTFYVKRNFSDLQIYIQLMLYTSKRLQVLPKIEKLRNFFSGKFLLQSNAFIFPLTYTFFSWRFITNIKI